MAATPYDPLINTKGQPKFGGWLFNGFDTRNTKRTAADTAQYDKIHDAVTHRLIEPLKRITSYECVPSYVTSEPVAEIEDLNVLAPDSINQSIPIKKLSSARPTRNVVGTGSWSQGQRDLMAKTDAQFDKLGKYVIDRFYHATQDTKS